MYSFVLSNLLAVTVAASFVVAVHKGQSFEADRNDPKVIKGRILRVSILCLILIFVLPFILSSRYINGYSNYLDVISHFRLIPNLKSLLQSFILISALYMGPLMDYFYSIAFDKQVLVEDMYAELTSIWGVRDLIFAPIVEELIYRSYIVTIYEGAANISYNWLVYSSPLLFGVAHIHHGYINYRTRKHSVSTICLTTLAQLLYTTIFGILATYLMLKNNSVWDSVLVHSICNCMSFPSMNPTMNSYLYYTLLIAGIISFYMLL